VPAAPSPWIATTVSVVAILLSGYGLYLQRRDRQPRLRVRALLGTRDRGGYVTVRDEWIPGKEVPALLVQLHNIGDRAVRVQDVRLVSLFGRRVAVDWRGTPYTIDGNARSDLFAYVDEITTRIGARLLSRVVRVEVEDEMGRRWRNLWFRIPRPSRVGSA